jgi:hypothetical protein
MTEALKAYQASRRTDTLSALRAAMKAIEGEIAEHGFYPRNGARVTRNELCRRAGIGLSTLKNPSHAATKAEVGAWLARVSKVAPRAHAAEGEGESSSSTWRMRYMALASQYHRFKVLYDELFDRCAALETENAQLKQDALRVVPLRRGR